MDLLRGLAPWLGPALGAATEHHERFDGNGYPRGLSGEQITLEGRIVAVADAYDVMTSARSYKKPLSEEAAREELARNAGTQFDPAVVRAFFEAGLSHKRRLPAFLGSLGELPGLLSNVGSTVTTATTTVAVAASTALVPPAVADAEPARPDALAMVDAETLAGLVEEPTSWGDIRNATPLEAPVTTATLPRAVDPTLPDAPTTTTTEEVLASTSTTSSPTTAPDQATTTTTTTSTTTTTTTPSTTTTTPGTTTTTTTSTTTTTTTEASWVTAAGDAGATAGSAIVISVLANDSFANGYEPGSLTVVVPAAHGTATPKAVNSSGAHVLYQPSAAGPQIDSFVYRVCDEGGSCSSATVLITINP